MSVTARPRSYNIVLILCFLIIIVTPLLGTLCSDKLSVSEQEKRRLAPFPEIEWNLKALLLLPKALEPYYNDHFFLRSQLVAANSLLRLKLFKRSSTFTILIGRDGWLFTLNDWALHDFLGLSQLTTADSKAWKRVLEQRRRWTALWGGRYLLVVVPNKMSVYPEKLPDRVADHAGVTTFDSLNDYLSGSIETQSILDLRDAMQREKSANQVYFKTDAHWNSWGAFIAYQEIMSRLEQWYPGIPVLDRGDLDYRTQESTKGDLSLMLGLQGLLREPDRHFSVRQPCATAKVMVRTPLVAKENQPFKSGCPDAAPLRVLAIGDSFMDSLQPYLSESFQEVIYDRDLEFNEMKNFIRSYRPDLILHIHVARLMPRAFKFDTGIEKELSDGLQVRSD